MGEGLVVECNEDCVERLKDFGVGIWDIPGRMEVDMREWGISFEMVDIEVLKNSGIDKKVLVGKVWVCGVD